MHTKYVGQKRFSLEGGESFIAAMDELVHKASAQGVQEIVIGMAHRGRLNVLVNTMRKLPADLFAEFDHTAPEDLPAGDVKYHQGFSSDISTVGGPVHLSLAFNPSHLEIVNPVVEGSVRARMDRRADPHGSQVLPVLVHGDAAFGGQGVNQETFALAQTRGYSTGGTVHIIINNQIGFTTSDPRDMRSSVFCTDIVKMVEAPVLHVNGDDPEAVVLATQMALDYRMTFKKDVVLDIVCFRKLGHNEQDTPALTQPLMYKKIAAHPGTRKLFADKLATQGFGDSLGDDMVKAYRAALDAGKHTDDPVLTNFKTKFTVDWAPFLGKKWTDAGDTSIPMSEWKRLAEKVTTIPSTVTPHQLVKKSMTIALLWAVAIPPSIGAWANIWPLLLWWQVATQCVCQAKTAGAVLSRTVTLLSMTKTVKSGTQVLMLLCKTWLITRHHLASLIPSCPKRPCLALNMVMPQLTQIL